MIRRGGPGCSIRTRIVAILVSTFSHASFQRFAFIPMPRLIGPPDSASCLELMFSPQVGRHRKLAFVSCLAMTVAMASACSKEEMADALEKAKAQTETITAKATEQIEDVLPETGRIQINGSGGLTVPQIERATVEVIDVGDGRPAIVQVMNYAIDDPARYPRVLIRGMFQGGDVRSLASKTIDCEVYLQTGLDEVAISDGAVCAVTFGAFNNDDGTIRGNLAGADLRTSAGTTVRVSDGEFVAVATDPNG